MARKFKLAKLKPRLLLPALILVIAGLLLLFIHNRHSSTIIPSNNPLAGHVGPGASQESPSDTVDNQNTGTQSTPDTSAGPPPTTPYGNFVSNHRPGGDAPTSEASSCNTSAGATCYIQFTNGATVKNLAAQTTDSKGATIWYWDIKSAGLSSGSWTVTAVATLNGQTKTADDSLPLVIE